MAEANILKFQDHFSCPVCLDLLKEPVTIPCGHSYCMVCINESWDKEDQNGDYSCPQCRQTFNPRPVVSKNATLSEVMETLKKTELQAPLPVPCSAGPEDVECDFCTGTKSKALRSCLVCLASFCETHLQPHYESPVFKRHKLIEASRRLQEQICSQHDKVLEIYCHTDQQCICMLCTMDKHKGHDTASAAAARSEKQEQLLKVQQNYKQEIQERELELQALTKAVESHKLSAQTAVQETERIFTELIKSIERRRSEVMAMIRAQEKSAVSRAEKILKHLEKVISELKRRDPEIEELSHTHDPIQYLQRFVNLTTSTGSEDISPIIMSSELSFEEVVKSVSQLQEKLDVWSTEQIEKISTEVKKVQIFPPQSREECLPYSCQFTLDPNTAYQCLQVSDFNKTVTYTGQSYYGYGYSERFDSYSQVLCKESVSGCCYWEVEWSGNCGVSIAVSYKDISRNGPGNECAFGRNDKSWNLLCGSSGYSFLHNNQETSISLNPSSSRIGVFVDHRAGLLSFYDVSDMMELLHRVHTTFNEPLYPGFTVNSYSTLKLCHSE